MVVAAAGTVPSDGLGGMGGLGLSADGVGQEGRDCGFVGDG